MGKRSIAISAHFRLCDATISNSFSTLRESVSWCYLSQTVLMFRWKKLEIKRYIVAALFLALAGAGCKGKHNSVAVPNDEEDTGPRLVSVLRMNDAKATAQLLSGFYGLENNSWRWTSGRFSALLRTPLAAAEHGATLTLAFTVPELVIQKIGKVTLRPSINGTALPAATYSAPGAYVYSADVPPALLIAESIKVEFALDRSLPPEVDKRELGIIATSVGIANK
jgi:hypothetical protein